MSAWLVAHGNQAGDFCDSADPSMHILPDREKKIQQG